MGQPSGVCSPSRRGLSPLFGEVVEKGGTGMDEEQEPRGPEETVLKTKTTKEGQ